VISGVAIALGAAACYEVAYVLQALEAREESGEHGLRFALLWRLARNPRWAGATALTVAGAALQIWALSLAPVTVVQPTLAVGLLALPLLARFVLKEHLTVREGLGVAAIVGGVSVVAAFGPTHVGRSDAGIELYVVLGVLWLALLSPFALRNRGMPPQLAVLGAASGDAGAALGLKLAADQLHRSRPGLALLWLVAGMASGAFALTAEMTALQQLRATRIAPVVVAFQVLVPVGTGLAFLGDSWRHTLGGGALLSFAVLVVVGGATLLSASRTVEEALGVEPEEHGGSSGELRE
jgi:drug/metabolite transporter (DMT)-like permease